MSVSSEESDIGSAEEEISCKYDGEEVSIALNYRYIEEPLKVLDEDELCVYFTEPNKVITLKPLPNKDYFHILMPMQLD
jgi:DNA polymerase-3 subunit beta